MRYPSSSRGCQHSMTFAFSGGSYDFCVLPEDLMTLVYRSIHQHHCFVFFRTGFFNFCVLPEDINIDLFSIGLFFELDFMTYAFDRRTSTLDYFSNWILRLLLFPEDQHWILFSNAMDLITFASYRRISSTLDYFSN